MSKNRRFRSRFVYDGQEPVFDEDVRAFSNVPADVPVSIDPSFEALLDDQVSIPQPPSRMTVATEAGNGIQDFYDLGLLIEGGGNMLIPRISKSDFAYYDEQGPLFIYETVGTGDGGTEMRPRKNPNYRPAGYYLTPEAQARLGEWMKNNNTSIGWWGPDEQWNIENTLGSTFSDFFKFLAHDDPTTIEFMGEPLPLESIVQSPPDRARADKAFEDFWNQQSINAVVKSADKAGTPIYWERQGDTFIPVRRGESFGVDTNSGIREMNRMLGLGLLTIGGASLLGLGTAGAGGGGAASGAGAAGAAETAALGGLGGVEPIAVSGFPTSAGGVGSLGSGWGSAGVVAGEAGAAGAGAAGAAGAAGLGAAGAAGAAGAGVAGAAGAAGAGAAGAASIPGWLSSVGRGILSGIAGGSQSSSGSSSGGGDFDWSSLFRGAGAILSDRDAERYTDRLLANRIQNAEQLRAAQAQHIGAYSPFYATVDTGIATSQIDPATGRVGFSLNAPYAAERDRLFGAAGSVAQQLGSYDPQAFARERYSKMQDLIAGQRQQAQQGLLQQLYNKGGFGLTLHGQGVDGSQAGVNPYVQAFAAANNQEDRRMAFDALQQGEAYLDNLIRRQRGLFGAGQDIDLAGSRAMGDALTFSNQFMGDRRARANFLYGMDRDYFNAVGEANRDAMYADALRRQGLINSLVGGIPGGGGGGSSGGSGGWLSSVVGSLPWRDIGNAIGGWFGQLF